MARSALAVVLFVLLLAGCGGDSNSSEGSQTPTTECEPLSGATLVKKLSPATQDRETMFLTDVEVEIEDCVERVTFKFKESEPGPGYDVSYQPPEVAKIQDGSGDPVAVAGGDFLVVRMFPAMTAEIDGEDVKPTYDRAAQHPRTRRGANDPRSRADRRFRVPGHLGDRPGKQAPLHGDRFQ